MPNPVSRISTLSLAGLLVLLGWGALCMISGCFLETADTGGSSGTTNGISGLIIDEDGQAVAEAGVMLYPSDYNPVNDDSLPEDWSTETDEDGKYLLKKVTAGMYNIEAVHSESDSRALIPNVEVTEAQEENKETVEAAVGILQAEATIAVSLENLALEEGGYIYIPGTNIYAVIDQASLQSGVLLLNIVPSGSFETITYLENETSSGENILTDELTVDPADTVSVGEPEPPLVTGVILDQYGDAAINAVVKLIPSDFNPVDGDPLPDSLTALTNTKGEYSFLGVDSGNYTLKAVSINDGSLLLVQDIQVSLDTTTIPEDTLTSPGTLVVALANTVITEGGYLFLPGTDIYKQVDAASAAQGFVTLEPVPANTYAAVMFSESTDISEAVTVAEDIVIKPSEKTTISEFDGWSGSASIVINTSATGADITEDVYDFPLLMRLDTSVHPSPFDSAQDDGSDLRFTNSNGLNLPYEIESWDAANEQAEIWVKVDIILGGNEEQYFIMFWGNDTASAVSNSHAVFDTANGFIGVWHLNEDGNNEANGYWDATARHADGTARNFTDASDQEGVIGKSQHFNGNNAVITIPGGGSNEINLVRKSFTVSAWAKTDSLNRNDLVMGQGRDSADHGLIFGYDTAGYFTFDFYGNWIREYECYSPTEWHYWTGTYNYKDLYHTLYQDGRLQILDHAFPFKGTGDLTIGRAVFSRPETFLGKIDEVRISTVARSESWIKLCYMTQRVGAGVVCVK